MAASIEIKARLDHRRALRERAQKLAGGAPRVLIQEDIFFPVPNGRLKLRVFGPDRGELIHYLRRDTPGPKRSQYTIAPIRDVGRLRAALSDALGVLGVVCKRREVYLIGQTRVHIDRVEGLGHFVELEVVLQPGQSGRDGERIARDLMAALHIPPESLIESAYLDLLLRASAGDDEGGP